MKTDTIESLFSSSAYPDHQVLAELNRRFLLGPLQDSSNLLDKDPKEIPDTDRCFSSNEFDLLTIQNRPCANHGIWKNCNSSLGWGIPYMDSTTFIGLKRTFVFHKQQPGKHIKTNWFMDVYSLIDDKNNVKTAMYMCQVRQASNYDPRPRCTRHTPMDKYGERLNSHMATLLVELHLGVHETSTDNGNPNSNGGGTLTGFASRGRSGAWGQFTKIEAYSPQGEGLTISICKHCCMVYRGGTTSCPHGTNHLNKHYCKCGCNQ